MRKLTGHRDHLFLPKGGVNDAVSLQADERAYLVSVDIGSMECETWLSFHQGPAAHPDGLTTEVLLEVLIDRLTRFQAGPLPSSQTHLALAFLKDAKYHIGCRTQDRRKRGVEGTNKP